ncbi:MAG: hypothetical protein R2845_01380 [Thermomicrobiales bacterium]
MLDHVRGFIFDIDGVLHVAWQPIPGAPAFFAGLRDRGIPFRMLTNSTVSTRATLASRLLRSLGFDIPEDAIQNAARHRRVRRGDIPR